jgi:hypothetical protein
MLCLVRMALWRHTDDEGQLSADTDSYEDENPKHIKLERKRRRDRVAQVCHQRDRSAASKVLEQWAAEELQAANCRQAAIGDATVMLPSLTFDTVFIFYHLWHHPAALTRLLAWHHTCQGVNQLK